MAKAKRLYYRIGQACKRLDIQPYVLRYWETEFPALSPDKSKSGQRVYSEEDLEIIRRIKELLYDEGFTIAGAKKRLEAELESGGPKARQPASGPSAPSEESKSETEPSAPAPELDTAATERIETLRQGVREALDQTRDLLSMLEASSAKSSKKRRSKKKRSAKKQ